MSGYKNIWTFFQEVAFENALSRQPAILPCSKIDTKSPQNMFIFMGYTTAEDVHFSCIKKNIYNEIYPATCEKLFG